MGIREQWAELSTGMQVLVGLGIGGALLAVALPVIVIGGAVVASFVLGMGGGEAAAADAPQVLMEFEYEQSGSESVGDTPTSPGELTIIHDGGDDVEASKLSIDVGSETVDWSDESGTVEPGENTTVEAGSDEVVQVVWESNGEARIIGEW